MTSALLLALVTTLSAPVNHLAKGEYANAADKYETAWNEKGEVDDLFNAAFYRNRAGEAERAKALASAFLTKVHCDAVEKLEARRVRHCGLAAEFAGQLDRAATLLTRYQTNAKRWEHRSRVADDLERIGLKREVRALKQRVAELEAAEKK